MQKIIILGQVIPKKNSKQLAFNSRTKRPIIISSKRYNQWHIDAQWQLKGVEKVTIYPVSVTMIFYMMDNRRRDLSNLAESVADTLVDAGILVDDNWKYISELHLKFGGISKTNARVEIDISPAMA